ncbi:lipoprotein [uncultured Algimonas sp.]|uniref:lipoprotein n=1 Tax=uncultured Algimonas sp. TaxID=1547920 RepID=UPI0026215293|nr:lipoprotein [uncultured Algimonas sp.]
MHLVAIAPLRLDAGAGPLYGQDMPVRISRQTSRLAALLLIAASLSACGIRGSLQTAPPLWGEGAEKPVETPEPTEEEDIMPLPQYGVEEVGQP